MELRTLIENMILDYLNESDDKKFVASQLNENKFLGHLSFDKTRIKKLDKYLESDPVVSNKITNRDILFKNAYDLSKSFVTGKYTGKNIKYNSALKTQIYKNNNKFILELVGNGAESKYKDLIIKFRFVFAKIDGNNIIPITAKEIPKIWINSIKLFNGSKEIETEIDLKNEKDFIGGSIIRAINDTKKIIDKGSDSENLFEKVIVPLTEKEGKKNGFDKYYTQDVKDGIKIEFFPLRKKISNSYVFVETVKIIHFYKVNKIRCVYFPEFDSYGYNPTEKIYYGDDQMITKEIESKDAVKKIIEDFFKNLPELRDGALKRAKHKASKTEKLL